jgi:hypothetical protein
MKITLTIVFFFAFMYSFSQNKNTKIQFSGSKYVFHGKRMSEHRLIDELSDEKLSPLVMNEIRVTKRFRSTGRALMITGCPVIFIGGLLALLETAGGVSNQVDYSVPGVVITSAILIEAGSLLLHRKANRHAKKMVELYNQSL